MRADPPDLVIADVMMSLSLDGLVIDHQMAQDPVLRDVPLLMVSAIVSETDAIARRKPETRRYSGLMRKPLGPSVLLQRVADILACEK
jgi:CheY-like chemotaxis protein